jgi:PAS domain S-box-containing protein
LKSVGPFDADRLQAGHRAGPDEPDPGSPARGDSEDALRQRAEAQLAELESIYRASPVGLCAVDRELRYVRANEEYAQIVGRSLDEIIGRSMHDVVHELAREPAVRLAQRVLDTGEPVWNAELPGVSREDPPQERVWLVNVHPLGPEGSRNGAIAVLQNVTVVKQAERLALARLQELESLYRNAPIGLAYIDRELRYVRVNAVLAKMNARSPREHIGLRFGGLFPEFAEAAERILRPLIDEGRSARDIEVRTRPPSDPEVEHVYLVSLEPVKAPDGSSVGLVSAVHDVTERVRAEEDAKLARQRAEMRLRELESAHRSLEREVAHRRQVEEKQRFLLRELDHRVKNTLATVQAMADQSWTSASSLESFRESFQGRIGAMARLHEALAGEHLAGIDLRRLVEMVVAPFDPGGRLSLEGPARIVGVETLRTLGMALHELATNAAKHGALSVDGGRVGVAWQEEKRAGGGPGLLLCWTESGGPRTERPSRRGFGTTFLEDGLQHELGATSRLEFRPAGLRCEISIPQPDPADPEARAPW